MKKKPIKVMVLSTLIATTAATSVIPTYTFAAENTKNPVSIHANATDLYSKYDGYKLGPDGLKEAMEKTGSNALVMDLYALTLLKQPNFNLSDLTAIDDSLKKQMLAQQKIARTNANTWIDTIKPSLLKTNQNIIAYNNKFDGYYNTLIKAAEEDNKTTLTKGLQRLSTSIKANKQEVDQLIETLKNYRGKLVQDTQNFSLYSDKITSIIAGENAGVPALKKQLEAHYGLVDSYLGMIIGGSLATALGPAAIVGGAAIIWTGAGTKGGIALISVGIAGTGGGIALVVKGTEGLNESNSQISSLTKQITTSEQQVALLTAVNEQVKYLDSTIGKAIDSLQSISDQWHTMGYKYDSLITSVNDVSVDDLLFIKEDLTVAKTNWLNIKDYAEKLYIEELKLVDKEVQK